MADFYVDHGAYAAQGSLGLNAPTTWGVPQEGDGSSKDAATASATAFVSFSATPTSGTISVCGVSISTTGVLNAASADAAANALATNINATTTAVAAGVAAGVPQLRNLVYARGPAGGAPAGTCQIMSRVGSAQSNYANNTNWLIAHTLNNSTETAGNRQFAGGSGGCWGWLLNTSAIGASSSIAVLAYGLFGASVAMMPNASQAFPTEFDTVWARTGAGQTIAYSSGSAFNINRSALWNLNLVFDDNSKWTGDSGNGVVTLDLMHNGGNAFRFLLANGAHGYRTRIHCKKRLNFVIKMAGNSSGSAGYILPAMTSTNASAILDGVKIWDAGTVSTVGLKFTETGQSYSTLLLANCAFERSGAFSSLIPLVAPNGNAFQNFIADGTSFTWNITGAGNPGPLIDFTSALTSVGSLQFRFKGCSFSGWPLGNDEFTLNDVLSAPPFNNGNAFFFVSAENCTGLKLSDTYAGLMTPTTARAFPPEQHAYLFQSAKQGGSMRYENAAGIIEWNPDAAPAYPLLAATQEDGATKWSQKMVWSNGGECGSTHGFSSLPLSQLFMDSAAAKTITLELFMKSAHVAALTFWQMRMDVTYINNATGKAVTESVSDVPVDSNKTWDNAGSYSGFGDYKLSLTTANAIKQYTEVVVKLTIFGKPGTGVSETFYLDPEFGIA